MEPEPNRANPHAGKHSCLDGKTITRLISKSHFDVMAIQFSIYQKSSLGANVLQPLPARCRQHRNGAVAARQLHMCYAELCRAAQIFTKPRMAAKNCSELHRTVQSCTERNQNAVKRSKMLQRTLTDSRELWESLKIPTTCKVSKISRSRTSLDAQNRKRKQER